MPFFANKKSTAGLVSLSNTRVFGLESGTSQAIHRPEVPSFWALMIDTAGPGELRSALDSDAEILDYMLQIGALNPALAAKLRELPPEERLHRFIHHTGERSRIIPPCLPSRCGTSWTSGGSGSRLCPSTPRSPPAAPSSSSAPPSVTR
jgi:hypothetical protein